MKSSAKRCRWPKHVPLWLADWADPNACGVARQGVLGEGYYRSDQLLRAHGATE